MKIPSATDEHLHGRTALFWVLLLLAVLVVLLLYSPAVDAAAADPARASRQCPTMSPFCPSLSQ